MPQLPYLEVKDDIVRVHLPEEWRHLEVEVLYDLENLPLEQNSNLIIEENSKIYLLDVKKSSGILHLSLAPANYQFNREDAYPDE